MRNPGFDITVNPGFHPGYGALSSEIYGEELNTIDQKESLVEILAHEYQHSNDHILGRLRKNIEDILKISLETYKGVRE